MTIENRTKLISRASLAAMIPLCVAPLAACGGSPTDTPEGLATSAEALTTPPAQSVSAGWNSACAITGSGGVTCWGDNSLGQLGDGTFAAASQPMQVSGLSSGVTSVGVGQSFACAIIAGGAVDCWGVNDQGQLGDPSASFYGTDAPGAVAGLNGVATALAVGKSTACAIVGGDVMCWGSNLDNELGQGFGTPASSSAPVKINLSGSATAVSVGAQGLCAIVGGGVECWGGQYALPFEKEVPQGSGVTSLSVGPGNACAVAGPSGVLCWSPVTSATTVAIGGATSVSVGTSFACSPVAGGGVECWGQGAPQFPSQYGAKPVRVAGLTSGVTDVSVGDAFACALSSCGVQCWGFDDPAMGYSAPVSIALPGSNSFNCGCYTNTVCQLPSGQKISPMVGSPPDWCSSRKGRLVSTLTCS